jgi:hypothetical protein
MSKRRRLRRIAGFVARYVSDDLLEWGAKADGRSTRGRTWKDPKPLLKIALLGLLAGCKGPSEVEELSKELPKPIRKLLGIPRRVPDTTLRDFLTKLDPNKLQMMLYVVGYDAYRRKALRHRDDIDIPFSVLSADGKYPSISDTTPYAYLQIHHQDGEATHGLVRTVTCSLVTALGRPILGAVPVLGSTKEQGGFQMAFGEMVRIYGRRFRLFMYDAGAASQDNADAVKAAGKEYLFLIADPRWQMYQLVELLLRDRIPAFVDEEKVSEQKRVIRKLTMHSVKPTRKNILLWKHTRTIFRIDNEVYENGELISTYTRFSVTSLEADELEPGPWLQLHVLRWGPETAHSILDTAFEEDDRPWIRKNAQGNLAVQLLRRVAFTLMTLYKNVTIRNEDESREPWRKQMEWVKDMLKWSNPEEVANLRPRTFAVPPALA